MTIDRDSSGTSTPRPDLDEVNDASFDSFPASDAPTWSSMHAGAPHFSGPSPASKPAASANEIGKRGVPAD